MAQRTKSQTVYVPGSGPPPEIVPHPPRPNRVLLAISVGLWLAWVGFLVWLAWQA